MNPPNINILLLGDIKRAAAAIQKKCEQFETFQESGEEISFSIDDKEYHDNYARAKGFENAGDLARFAMKQYETRYPLKVREKPQGCTSKDELKENKQVP